MLDAPFPYIGVLQKEPSSFRIYGNPFIILMLQAEGCFRHLSAKLHSAGKRTENQSAENEKSFAAERKIVLSRLIFQSQEIDFAFISIYYTKVYRIIILEEEQRNTKPWL